VATEERGPSLETTIRRGRAAVVSRAERLKALTVEYLPTADLKPNKYNPNRQSPRDFDLLLRSIREDGFTQPIVAQRATLTIVDGEHRWRAAREVGLLEVPVVLVDMSDEQMRVATLRHNRARGSEDVDLGAQVLRDLRELGALAWAQDSLMINDAELDRLISDAGAAVSLAADTFAQAWAPTRASEQSEDRLDSHSGISLTTAARVANSEHELAMRAARTDEDRSIAERKFRNDVFRLELHYRGSDAELVRRVLGASPAARVVELCAAKNQAGAS